MKPFLQTLRRLLSAQERFLERLWKSDNPGVRLLGLLLTRLALAFMGGRLELTVLLALVALLILAW